MIDAHDDEAVLAEQLAKAEKLFGISAEAIMGRSRYNCDVIPRQYVMIALRRAGWSLPQIGARFGRHHTSVLWLTRDYQAPPPVEVVRPVKRAVVRVPVVRSPEHEAEVHQRNYAKMFRRDAIKGSRALLEAQIRFHQYPCKLIPRAEAT